MVFSKINLMVYSPLIVSFCVVRWGQWGCFCLRLSYNKLTSYIFNTNKISQAKTKKIRKIQSKSTEKIFSVENKSTIKYQQPSETRYWLASLSKKPKKINIDQL